MGHRRGGLGRAAVAVAARAAGLGAVGRHHLTQGRVRAVHSRRRARHARDAGRGLVLAGRRRLYADGAGPGAIAGYGEAGKLAEGLGFAYIITTIFIMLF